MMTNKQIGWCAIILLLIIAIYCEFEIGNSIYNAVLDVVVAFLAFYIGQRDANKKNVSLQNQIHELQVQIDQLMADAKHDNQDNIEEKTKPTSNILWEHAIKR